MNTLALAATERRYREVRRRLGRLRTSNYDISDRCNLTCEGCLYFSTSEERTQGPLADDHAWERLFQNEAARGVNFAYIAGAEPTLEPARIRAAWGHIPAGVVFSNGTRRVDPDIGYRVHVSVWGAGAHGTALRGADVVGKALRLYAGDRRAVFVLTVNALNLGDIRPLTRACADHGVTLAFSLYSPTVAYNRYAAGQATTNEYQRLAVKQGQDPRLDASTLARTRDEIAAVLTEFPATVRASLHYTDWISRPVEELCDIGPDGIARDCGNRLTAWHRHYGADASRHDGKCCSPNIDCRTCRAYAMGLATYLTRHREFAQDPAAFAAWVDTLSMWADLFMPLAQTTPAPPAVQLVAAS